MMATARRSSGESDLTPLSVYFTVVMSFIAHISAISELGIKVVSATCGASLTLESKESTDVIFWSGRPKNGAQMSNVTSTHDLLMHAKQL